MKIPNKKRTSRSSIQTAVSIRSAMSTSVALVIRVVLPAVLLAGILVPQAAPVYAAPHAPPIAVPDDRFDQPVGIPLSVDVLDNDIDGDNNIDPSTVRILNPVDLSQLLTYVVEPGEGVWQVNSSNGSITFSPCTRPGQPDVSCTGAFRDDPFPMEYSIGDQTGLRSNPAIITITVDPNAATPPVLGDDQATTTSGQAVVINVLANDSDSDGQLDPDSVTISEQPSHGDAQPNSNGTITYTPSADYTGQDQFTYRVCNTDPAPQCDTANVFISVTQPAENQAPILFSDSPPAIAHSQMTVIDVLANDSDPDGELDESSVSVTVLASHGIATPTRDGNGSVTYTPTNGFSGSDQFKYNVCDNGSPTKCGEATVFLTVLPPTNQAPTARDDQASTLVNQPVEIDVLTNDVDVDGNLDPTSLSVPNLVTNGRTELSNGFVLFTPSLNFSGEGSFVYEICDTFAPPACASATVRVLVIAPSDENEAYAFDDEVYVRAGESVTGNILSNDLDPEEDGWRAPITNTLPAHGTLQLETDGLFTYTANSDFAGDDNWTYQVCDQGTPAACDDATVVITVAPANTPPYARNDAAVTSINTLVNGNLLTNDTDPDGDILTVATTPTVAPQSGQVVLTSGGHFAYTPNAGTTGLDTFTYQVCDPDALCDTADVLIDVRAPNMANAAPYAMDDQATTRPDSPVRIVVLANDSDLDGAIDPASVTVTTAPSQGQATVDEDGVVTFTPTMGAGETASFSYRACDNGAPILCAAATVSVEIVAAGANSTYAYDDAVWGRSDRPLQGNVLANDIDLDGDPQSVEATPVLDPVHGQLVLTTSGAFTYTPEAGYAGTDQFTYRLCDDGMPQACDTAVVSLHLFPPNLGWDFGDAFSFPTTLGVDGPRHAIVSDLSLGDVVDAEADSTPNSSATADDETDLNDEFIITVYPIYDGSGVYRLDVPVTNRTSYAAQLAGWVDWNVNFSFDDPGERSLPTLSGDGVTAIGAGDDTFATGNIPPGYVGVVTLTWDGVSIPSVLSPAKHVRLRLAGDLPGSAGFFTDAGPSVTGPSTGGSVVDILAPISTQRVNVRSFTALPTVGSVDDAVNFAWTTTLEDGVAGFNLLVERAGELVAINTELIPSQVTNSTTATDYAYAATVEGDTFYLQVVMLSGDMLLSGSTRLGVIPPSEVDRSLFMPMILSIKSEQ